jgi:hypothetical protein
MGDLTLRIYCPGAKSRTASPFMPETALADPMNTAVKGMGEPVMASLKWTINLAKFKPHLNSESF